eukprot:5401984-Pleurochrysis_carterae.AAC.2
MKGGWRDCRLGALVRHAADWLVESRTPIVSRLGSETNMWRSVGALHMRPHVDRPAFQSAGVQRGSPTRQARARPVARARSTRGCAGGITERRLRAARGARPCGLMGY